MRKEVAGCPACRELAEKGSIQSSPQPERSNNLSSLLSDDSKMEEHAQDPSKSLRLDGRGKKGSSKRRRGAKARFKEEPDWWGVGISRILSVGPAKMVDEMEIEMCEKSYPSRTQTALVHRQNWKEFLSLLQKKFFAELSKTRGPDWFQDLSPRQMDLFDKLREIVEVDIQEGITSRTQRALYDIGVYPTLPSSVIQRCMHECKTNMIKFIFMIHKAVVERDQKLYEEEYMEAVKNGNTVPRYSISERILLSGVFHIHFDAFTQKLNKILPPSIEKPKIVIAKKRAAPPKQKYKSPFLEPLPLPPKVWFEQRAEDDLYKNQARLIAFQEKKEFERRVLLEAEAQKKAKEEKLKKLHQKTSPKLKSADAIHDNGLQRENKSQILKRFSTNENKKTKGNKAVEISKSVHHMKKNKKYMYDVVHESIQTKSSFGGFFSADNKMIKDTEGANLKIRLVPQSEKIVCLYKDQDFKPVQVLDTRVRICCRDVAIQTSRDPMFLPLDVNPEEEFYKLNKAPGPSKEVSTNTTSNADGKKVREDANQDLTTTVVVPNPAVECWDESCSLIKGTIPVDEFEVMREKIKLYTPENQLKTAVAFLCRRGDPMAVLPRIEDTPWLLRWFEQRRGIKERLTEDEKNELMQSSLSYWKSNYPNTSQLGLKYFDIHSGLTTLQQKAFVKYVKKYKLEFQSRCRAQLVNNARDLFPSMYLEYFTSPLCKSMRKTYFTYLSSREMDPYVYKAPVTSQK